MSPAAERPEQLTASPSAAQSSHKQLLAIQTSVDAFIRNVVVSIAQKHFSLILDNSFPSKLKSLHFTMSPRVVEGLIISHLTFQLI